MKRWRRFKRLLRRPESLIEKALYIVGTIGAVVLGITLTV
jgi:hypothetical protein